MASISTLFFVCLLIFSAIDAAVAERKVFKVGGEEGWKVPDENNSSLYSHWATSHRFHVGDSLYFSYVNDSVLVVDKLGFFHCNTTNPTNPTNEFNNGKAMVELTNPGLYFFISGAPHHCEKGQRLIVEVMHFHNSPPSIANPPAGNSPSSSPSASHSSGHHAASITLVSLVLVVLVPMLVALVAF